MKQDRRHIKNYTVRRKKVAKYDKKVKSGHGKLYEVESENKNGNNLLY